MIHKCLTISLMLIVVYLGSQIHEHQRQLELLTTVMGIQFNQTQEVFDRFRHPTKTVVIGGHKKYSGIGGEQ